MYRAVITAAATTALPALAIAVPSPGEAAKRTQAGLCTSKAGKALIKRGGKITQTLTAGRYRAYRRPGGNWTLCDNGGRARSGIWTVSIGDGPSRGVALSARAGKCLLLQTRTIKADGAPTVALLDARRHNGDSSVMETSISARAAGGHIVKTALSSTCLVAVAWVAADGSRHIMLGPGGSGWRGSLRHFDLSESATDADLRSLRVKGDEAQWTDGGERRTERYG